METKLGITLKSIAINDELETDVNLQNLISSEIGTSIATKVPGLGISEAETSDTLVSINVAMVDKKNPEYADLDIDVGITFGTLFVNVRPSAINRLMVFFIPIDEEQRDRGLSELDESMTSNILGNTDDSSSKKAKPKIVKKEVNSEKGAIQVAEEQFIDLETDKIVQINVDFSLERISVILVNEVSNIYQAHASISEIGINFQSKLSKISVSGSLSNLQLHDLTNYPDTLKTSDFASIKPNELFGILESDKKEQSSLISLKFEQLNNLMVRPFEDLSNGILEVTIS